LARRRVGPTSGKQESREDDPANELHGVFVGNGVNEGVKVEVGMVAVGMNVAVGGGAVVAVGGTVVKLAVTVGVLVGKFGMIVTPGTGVRVGTLGTQSL
jgi:hypothetical protein